MAHYRKDRANFNPARLSALQKALASLGRTPVDRSRLAAPAPMLDPNDPWAKLVAKGWDVVVCVKGKYRSIVVSRAGD